MRLWPWPADLPTTTPTTTRGDGYSAVYVSRVGCSRLHCPSPSAYAETLCERHLILDLQREVNRLSATVAAIVHQRADRRWWRR